MSSINQFSTVEVGNPFTKEYRVYFKDEKQNKLISPFHDVPLFQDHEKKIFNMIVEIPRWTCAKMEINKIESFNPITQDIKKNQLRFVHNTFPYYGYIWNYGALPQTWEDPNHIDELTQCKGDNDPIDVCEIGTKKKRQGSIVGVKVLGALGLIDEGEADWKIIAIDNNDDLAGHLNTIDDVRKKFPELLNYTNDWFKIYKIPSGKPVNNIALNGEYLNREEAIKIIEQTHIAWSKMFTAKNDQEKEISLMNSSLQNSQTIAPQKSIHILNEIIKNTKATSPQVNLDEIEKIFYINRSTLKEE